MVRKAHEPGAGATQSALTDGLDFRQRWLALTGGESAAADDLLDEDAVLRIPGRTRISGTYRGRAAILDYFRTLRDAMGAPVSHEIDDLVLSADEGHATELTQRVGVERRGQEIVDLQRVFLRYAKGRLVDVRIEALDRDTHEEMWGRGALFTDADREILADAIRKGMSRDRDPTAERRDLVVGLVLLAALVSAFYWLVTTRFNQNLFASTTSLGAVRQMTVAHPKSDGQWAIGRTYVRRVEVREPFGQVNVVLPVPASECGALAADLGETCTGGAILLQPVVYLDWSRPARLNVEGRDTSRFDLNLSGMEDDSRSFELDVTTFTQTPPRFCFTQPDRNVGLQIATSTGGSAIRRVRAAGPLLTCRDGVVLRVGVPAGETFKSSTVLQGVSEVSLDARGTRAELDGLAGKLSLVNVRASVFDPAAHIAAESRASAPVTTSLRLSPAERRLVMRSESVKSVLTDEGELLPTKWSLLPQPFAGMAGALFGVLVLPEIVRGLPWLRERLFFRRKRREIAS
jgi:ketosteroid isomerase-like protein